MAYVHLANGDVEKVTEKELAANRAASGSPNVFRKNGMEHHVVGVYPEEYEHPESEEVQAEKAKQNDADRAEFEQWKANQKTAHDPADSNVDWNVGAKE